jgi:hypothetical protein
MSHEFSLLDCLSPAPASATTGESCEGDLVDLAAVGALDGIVLGPFFPQLGQPVGDGGIVHVELAVAAKACDGCHKDSPFDADRFSKGQKPGIIVSINGKRGN